jgi:hypothetical protein
MYAFPLYEETHVHLSQTVNFFPSSLGLAYGVFKLWMIWMADVFLCRCFFTSFSFCLHSCFKIRNMFSLCFSLEMETLIFKIFFLLYGFLEFFAAPSANDLTCSHHPVFFKIISPLDNIGIRVLAPWWHSGQLWLNPGNIFLLRKLVILHV